MKELSMGKLKQPLNQVGFSLIEVMVATAIIGLAGVGFNLMSGSALFLNHYQSQLQTMQLAVESNLIEIMTLNSSYTAAQSASLKAGSTAGLIFNWPMPAAGAGKITIGSGVPQYFDNTGALVQAGSANAQLQMDSDVTCSAAISSGAYQVCALAYRISAYTPAGKQNKTSLSPVGAPGLPGAVFQPEDYLLPIPYQAYALNPPNQLMCDPVNDLAMSGYSNIDNGSVSCIQVPNLPCGPTQIAKGLTYSAAGPLPVTGTLNPTCVNSSTLSCPLYYVMQSFNPATLDPTNGPASGTCVLLGEDKVAWQNSLGPAVSIPPTKVCPLNYNLVSVVASLVGASGANANCSCPGPASVSFVPGSAQWSSPSQGKVTAWVNTPAQPSCPTCMGPLGLMGGETASWSAQVSVNGSCQAITPNVPANSP